MKKLLFFLLMLPMLAAGQGFECVVRGTVTGRCRAVVIFDPFTNHNTWDETVAPVVDGKFEYTLKGDHVRQYHIAPVEELERGNMWMRPFYPDAGVVEIRIGNVMERGGDQERDYEVRGGELNEAMKVADAEKRRLFGERRSEVTARMRVAEKDRNDLSPQARELHRQLDSLYRADADHEEEVPIYDKIGVLKKQRLYYTPEAQKLHNEYDAITAESSAWMREWMAGNPDLHSYAMLLDEFRSNRFLPDDAPVYAILAAAHPGHPYGKMVETALASRNTAAGGRFVDFAAPDLAGVEHTISREIGGKVAVLDLWASWCGPCIVHSRQLVPLYEKYKERGFSIVGVAREYKNTRALEEALAREKFPWLNLVEMDDKTGIWAKYGVRAAGALVLIDASGTVANAAATTADIEKYLVEKFGR